MKTATITLLFVLLLLKVYAQYTPFVVDKAKDALWIKQLVELNNKQQLAEKKNPHEHIEWVNGKVLYSPDRCLRIAQLSADSNSFMVAVQCVYQNKVLNLKLFSDSVDYDFQDHPITHIYQMAKSDHTYLILSSTVERSAIVSDQEDDKLANKGIKPIEKSYQVASLVRIKKDSLTDIVFKMNDDNSYSEPAEIISGKSLYLKSYRNVTKHRIKPFLKFDPVKNELSFLTTYCGNGDIDEPCDAPYLKVRSGTFKYKDDSFTLVGDDMEYYPSLEKFDRTIAVKKYRTGELTTTVTATKKYEEIGAGVLRVLHVTYKVQGQSIAYVDYNFDEQQGANNLKPDYKVQNDGGLIFLITDTTNPNHGGMCGACQDDDSQFWLISNNKKKLLFSFNSNSGNPYTSYTYNDGKSEKSGKFYLQKSSQTQDEWNVTVDRAYWKNSSTYVVRVNNETFARNYYINFVTINNTTTAKLVAGKMERLKQKPIGN